MEKRRVDFIIAFILFVVALAVYNATLTPSLSYKSPDGNELATIPYVLGLAHSTGYPLYTWLGKLFTFIPIGDVAHRVNLMSATLGAGGVGLLYLVIVMTIAAGRERGMTGPLWLGRLAAACAALLFAFSVTFWSQTVIAEVYAPNVFMIALTIWLLLKWAGPTLRARYLLAFALVFGLSLGTHMSNLGFAPAFVVFILLVGWRELWRRWWLIPAMGFLFALGVLQFLWLPYKANTLNDAPMLRIAPMDLHGIYQYTLGAFPQFKFAFPWWALPERVVLYLMLLREQFGLLGILVGIYGMAEMTWRSARRFYLFALMYLVHVWFFIQYRAFDIDVFFIAAHLLYAVFIGYGLYCLLARLGELAGKLSAGFGGRAGQVATGGLLALLLAWPVGAQLKHNWTINDCSQETAINDFYENAFRLLPEGSVLLGSGGVFGFDMFYFRLVYDIRPDVLIPMLAGPRPNPQEMAGRPIYTTTPGQGGRGGGPWSPSPGLLSPDAWYVPVLVGGSQGTRRSLTLYEASREPPALVVEQANPQHVVGHELGALDLLGYDLESQAVEAGGALHLTLYWRVLGTPQDLIVLGLGERSLEAHELGFGNLSRYMETFHSQPDGIVVEDYHAVIPSTVEPGEYPLTLGSQARWEGGPGATTITLTTLKVSETGEQ